MKSPIGADVVVEVVLKYDRSEWPRVTAELCAGDPSLEGLVTRLLAHYDRPDQPLPDGPYPVELGPFIAERAMCLYTLGRPAEAVHLIDSLRASITRAASACVAFIEEPPQGRCPIIFVRRAIRKVSARVWASSWAPAFW